MRREILGGRVRAELQCQRCGSCWRAVKQAGIVLSELPAIDPDIEGRWRASREELTRQRQDEIEDRRTAESREWWAAYDRYRTTPKWADLRARTLSRAGYKCEGCGQARATQAHHLTYAHVGDEMLFDLIAICEPCHERVTAMDRAARVGKRRLP